MKQGRRGGTTSNIYGIQPGRNQANDKGSAPHRGEVECAGQAEKQCLALVASHLSKRLMIFIPIDLIQWIFQGVREHNTL